MLLSDGTSNVGVSPIAAANAAKQQKVRIYTIAIGTSHGTMKSVQKDGKSSTVPVPVSPGELEQIAATSGGKTYRAVDSDSANQIYTQLAAKLGHKREEKPLTAIFAGGGLVLLLAGGALSLWWFGRLA